MVFTHLLNLLLMLMVFSSALCNEETQNKGLLKPSQRIAALIDPVKLAGLSARGANPRVQKYVAQLEEARLAGWNPVAVVAEAVKLAGFTGQAATLTSDAMLRNLIIAERLGCLTPIGLHDMRRGQSPTITLGPYAGDQLSVDHIIPFAFAPQLDKTIANLELMPLRLNAGKGKRMGQRQNDLLMKFKASGLIDALPSISTK